jgi:hypothetical protein
MTNQEIAEYFDSLPLEMLIDCCEYPVPGTKVTTIVRSAVVHLVCFTDRPIYCGTCEYCGMKHTYKGEPVHAFS